MNQLCPRCGIKLKDPVEQNARSSLDSSIWLCSSCGRIESKIYFMLNKLKSNVIDKSMFDVEITEKEIEMERNFCKKLGVKSNV